MKKDQVREVHNPKADTSERTVQLRNEVVFSSFKVHLVNDRGLFIEISLRRALRGRKEQNENSLPIDTVWVWVCI
jgi:hypothetical protein